MAKRGIPASANDFDFASLADRPSTVGYLGIERPYAFIGVWVQRELQRKHFLLWVMGALLFSPYLGILFPS